MVTLHQNWDLRQRNLKNLLKSQCDDEALWDDETEDYEEN